MPQDPIPDFHRLLQGQKQILELLSQDLQSERQGVRDGDIELIETTSQNKVKHLGELSDVVTRLSEFMSGRELTLDSDGMNRLLEREPAHEAEIRTLWGQVEELLIQCQQLNQNNGQVIENSYRSLMQTLMVLRGENKHPSSYSANGAVQSPASQTLAKV